MCDYCGCRRQPAIDELSEEHEQLLNVVYRLRRAAAGDDHRAVVAALELELSPLLRRHTDKEERGLFAQLRDAWSADDRLDTLVDEHRRIEERLATVAAGGAGWQRELVRLGDELSEHVFDEETDLFPYALYELRDEQWAAVAAVHDRAAGFPTVVASGS